MSLSPKNVVSGGLLAVALVTLQARQVRSMLPTAHPQLTQGAVAPLSEFVGADGSPIPVSEFRGHPLVVSFWAAWCAPCRKELPEVAAVIDSWNAKAAAADRVVFVTVNQGDEPNSVSMFVEDRRLRSARFTFDSDGRIGKQWNVRAFPTTFLVDRNGGIRDVQEGYDRAFYERLETLLSDEGRTKAQP